MNQNLENLLFILKKPTDSGTAYALGNWCYENIPELPCTTLNIFLSVPKEELTIETLHRIIALQEYAKGVVPSVKEEINRYNKEIYKTYG